MVFGIKTKSAETPLSPGMHKSEKKQKQIAKGMILLGIIPLFCFFLAGCEKQKNSGTPEVLEFFSMDTYISLSSYGENAEEANTKARKEIESLEACLSTEKENSEIYELNRNGKGILSESGRILWKTSRNLYEKTGGAFNPLIYPAMKLWGFPDKKYRVPSEKERKKAVLLADMSKAVLDEKTGELSLERPGMKLDFGGIAKGYIADRAKETLQKNSVTAGVISLGGNICTWGRKPGENGKSSKFRIAVQSPEKDGTYLGVLETENTSVVTSGGYERFFEKNGRSYHHILNPQTAMPAESGLKSVTIVSADGTLADGLSTSLFVMGAEKAEQFWQSHKEDFEMILCAEDGGLTVSAGLKNSFQTEREKVRYLE